MDDVNWLGVGVLVIISMVLGALIFSFFIKSNVDELTVEEIDSKIAKAVSDAEDIKNEVISDLEEKISNLQNFTGVNIDESGKIISDKGTVIISKEGYLVDEVFLEIPLDKKFSDRELNLFDGEVEFDGEDYDAEEVFTFKGLELLANEKDFDGNVYLTLPKEGLSYEFIFETNLDTSEIGDDDETLTFDFLGEEIEISKWEVNKITLTQGEEYFITELENIIFKGKEVTLEFVLPNAAYITVDGEGIKILEGEIKRIGGLEIKASEILYTESAIRKSKATLIIDEDVEITISDGDEYDDGSIWEWRITENSIGLILSEEFNELDDDFNALGLGEFICLPKDYYCIRYDGLVEGNEEEYSFELDTRNGLDYVKVNGDFLSGINDYDRVYINDTGIFDRDFELISSDTIELGDTDSVLSWNNITKVISINDINISYNLYGNYEFNDIWYNSLNISSKDENYLTAYGILIDNPEDSVESQEITLRVPDEKLEGKITIVQGRLE